MMAGFDLHSVCASCRDKKGQVLCTRQVAYRTSFLSRQPDVIASFFVWCMYSAHRFMKELKIQGDFGGNTLYFCITDSRRHIDYYVFS